MVTIKMSKKCPVFCQQDGIYANKIINVLYMF